MATPEPASAVGMSREALNQAATRARAIPACDPTDCSLIPRPTINHSGEPLGDLAIPVLRGVLVQLGSHGSSGPGGLEVGLWLPQPGRPGRASVVQVVPFEIFGPRPSWPW